MSGDPVCSTCGAVVGDVDLHVSWHVAAAETADNARHASMMTRPIGPRPGKPQAGASSQSLMSDEIKARIKAAYEQRDNRQGRI